MKATRIVLALTIAALAVSFGLSIDQAAAQKTKGKTRLASTEFLMERMVRPNCADLGKILKDGPASDKDWHHAASHAACLNEMSYVLMADGRCPDGVWAKAAGTTLREGSAEVYAAIEAKDIDTARTAFKKLTSACAACHKEHKD